MSSDLKVCICILGMHRSGTSAISSIIADLGYDFGQSLVAGSYDNPRGFYENQRILEINELLLLRLGKRWDNLIALNPDWYQRERYQDVFDKAIALLKSDFQAAGNIAIKDPRLCLLFPFWKEVLSSQGYAIKVVLAHRKASSIIASLAKRNNFGRSKSSALILAHLLSAELHAKSLAKTVVSYDELLNNVQQTVSKLREFLEGKSSLEEDSSVGDSIDPALNNELNTVVPSGPEDKLSSILHSLLSETEGLYAELQIRPSEELSFDALRSRFLGLEKELKPLMEELNPYLKVLVDRGEGYSEKNSFIKEVTGLEKETYTIQLTETAHKIKILFEHLPNSLHLEDLKVLDTNKRKLDVTLVVNGYPETSTSFGFNSKVKALEVQYCQDSRISTISFRLAQSAQQSRPQGELSKLGFWGKALVTIASNPINFLKNFNLQKLKILKSALGRENPKLILRNFKRLIAGGSSAQQGSRQSSTTKKSKRMGSKITSSKDLNPLKSKLVFVSNEIPDPEKSSGGKRSFEILKILSQHFNVFFYQTNNEPNTEQLASIPDLSFVTKQKLRKFQQSGDDIYAIIYSHYYTRKENGYLEKLFPIAKVIVDSVDLHWVRETRSLGLWDGVSESQVAKNKISELKAYEDADSVWVVSEAEKTILLDELPDISTAVVSNIHQHEQVSYSDSGENKMLFVGGFDHYPNISAVAFIVEQIMPLVVSKVIDVELVIAGHKSIEAVGHLASSNVKVLGSVSEDKLRELYSDSVLSLVPLLAGAGVKGKITEAINKLTPVVTNAIGNEGIGLVDGVSGFIAEEPMALAERVVSCLRREVNLESIAKNALEQLSGKYSQQTASKAIGSSLYTRVSICIVTWNKLDLLKDCIQSVLTHTHYPNWELIVYSNGCTDGTQEYLEQLSREESRINLILSEKNDVFVIPNNRMFDFNSEADVVMLNNDTIVANGWLTALWVAAYNKSSTGVVGSKLLNPDGSLQEYGSEIFSDGVGKNYGKNDYDPDDELYAQPQKVPYVSGCSMYIKRSTISAIGKLDESLHPCYYEDSDYCYRAWVAGLQVWVTPYSLVTHLEGATSGKDIASGFKKYQSINKEKFLQKHADNISKVKQLANG